MNLLYQRWQMDLIQSYRERDEDYCVHIHPNHQFLVCVYITMHTRNANSMWYSEVVGNIIHYSEICPGL